MNRFLVGSGLALSQLASFILRFISGEPEFKASLVIVLGTICGAYCSWVIRIALQEHQ